MRLDDNSDKLDIDPARYLLIYGYNSAGKASLLLSNSISCSGMDYSSSCSGLNYSTSFSVDVFKLVTASLLINLQSSKSFVS